MAPKKLREYLYDFVAAWNANDPWARECWAAIAAKPVPDHSSTPNRLYATEIGRCPKRAMHRMHGDPKIATTDSEELMFDIANQMEARLAAAFMYANELVEWQFAIPFDDLGRENWGGRGDLLVRYPGKEQAIIEFKTTRPRAFDYADFPKADNVHQAVSYREAMKVPTWLFYADRGGSNPPEEYAVTVTPDETFRLMDELEAYRAGRVLPPILPKLLKYQKYNQEIAQVPHWACGYCPYAGTVCTPHTGSSVWAVKESGAWRIKKACTDEYALDMFISEGARGKS
jgi:hypothetical protein